MISIIISSANAKYLKDIHQNIEETIGVPFEIISTDNSNGVRGICAVYNEAANKASFDILCYMHEDLKMLTQKWGLKVVEKFKNDLRLGIIGVVGSSYKPLAPSGWGAASALNHVYFSHYIQHYKHKEKAAHLIDVNPSGKTIENVACVDGMWFCTRKEIVSAYPFDQELLKGFHCYDIDFCLNVGRNFNVAVVFDILMEHFSEGSYNKSWIEDTIKIHKKWQKILPVSTVDIKEHEKENMEKRAFKMLFKKLKELGYTYGFARGTIDDANKTGKLRSLLYYKLQFYLFKYFFIKYKKD